jgi:mannose-6-phosphate isomerase-like protein (cupin superfamily)
MAFAASITYIHPVAPEAYYVLEGEYHVKYGSGAHQLRKGDFVFIPKSILHNINQARTEEGL